MKIVVCNASPIIALHQIEELDLMDELFESVVVPPAVESEVRPSLHLPSWIEVRPLAQPIGVQILAASLGWGESETIALALEMEAEEVLLDDRAARLLARTLNLPVAGVLAILTRAKQEGLIDALQPRIEKLLRFSFRLSPRLINEALHSVSEIP